MQVMTPDHVRWAEFCTRLDDEIAATGMCTGDLGQHKLAKLVLADMSNDIDIALSLEFFKAHGGYCDCEILLNVDRD